MEQKITFPKSDIVLIGGGIMSATLGMLLKQLMPGAKIQIIEALDKAAMESSDAWNNAGTGHAALCELNYTSRGADGEVNIDKAIKINKSFEESKQFWAWLIEQGVLTKPHDFINAVAHMSFVWGDDGVQFLKDRFDKMSQHHFFSEMEYSENEDKIKEWAPLLLQGRLMERKLRRQSLLLVQM